MNDPGLDPLPAPEDLVLAPVPPWALRDELGRFLETQRGPHARLLTCYAAALAREDLAAARAVVGELRFSHLLEEAFLDLIARRLPAPEA